MKRTIVLFVTLFLLILSAQAQRRHNHFRRVKVEKINPHKNTDINTPILKIKVSNSIPVATENFIETNADEISSVTIPETNNIEVKSIHKKKELKESRTVSTNFFQSVLKTHLKLTEVKDVKKPMLRTWKWLVIAASILVAIGIVLLILVSNLPHPAASFALAFGIGCVVVGVLLALIFLILGLTGRI